MYRDVEMKKSNSKQVYIISRLLYGLCMTSGIPAIESKGHPYSFMTSPMEDGLEHTASFHDYLPNFPNPPKQMTTQASTKKTRMLRLPSRLYEELLAISIT